MKPRLPAVLLATLAAFVLAPAPAAADVEARGISQAEVAEILHDLGYRAKPDTDGEGEGMIRTKLGGLNVDIYFYDCNQGRCGSLSFSVGLDLEDGTTLEVINRYNAGFRYGHAYLDDEMDPFLQYDFEMINTDHAAYLASQVDLFETLLQDFTLATGFREPSATEAPAVEAPRGDDAGPAPKPAKGKIDV